MKNILCFLICDVEIYLLLTVVIVQSFQSVFHSSTGMPSLNWTGSQT